MLLLLAAAVVATAPLKLPIQVLVTARCSCRKQQERPGVRRFCAHTRLWPVFSLRTRGLCHWTPQ